MKFGIMVPNDITHTRQLDTENGNNIWEKSIRKEVFNVVVAFDLLDTTNPHLQYPNILLTILFLMLNLTLLGKTVVLQEDT